MEKGDGLQMTLPRLCYIDGLVVVVVGVIDLKCNPQTPPALR